MGLGGEPTGTGTTGDEDLLGLEGESTGTGTTGDEDLLGSSNNTQKKEIMEGIKTQIGPVEKHLYHVRLKKPLYDTKTGEDKSSYTTQKLSIAEYRMLEKNGKGLGYEIEVLHNPED